MAADGSDPGSFRDPESRVFFAGSEVRRALSREGLRDFQALADTGLLSDPRVIGTEPAADAPPAPGVLDHDVAMVLRHERIPFVSYPYEWSFSMLKAAALLQLDLMLEALRHGLVLKDASPYNVQFMGARPVFIDVGSFERMRAGELWAGYRQFCTMYLFPLLLQSLKGVDFQPWLRGSIDGITATQMRGLMSFRDRFRRGIATNVLLHARLEHRDASSGRSVRRAVAGSTAEGEIVSANVRKMRKLVARLESDPPAGVWVRYREHNSYDEAAADRKRAFVADVVARRPWDLVWDLGANTGTYSRVAVAGARTVVAIDADPGVVELLFRDLSEAGDETILPLTMNLADPSPSLGWRSRERRTLLERGRPDLVLALALVHHLAIGANVPVREIVGWLADIGADLIIEFPGREDAMVRKLLGAKRDGLHPDYEIAHFERCLEEAFTVRERQPMGTRTMYFASPR
jgi:hypothetical protein